MAFMVSTVLLLRDAVWAVGGVCVCVCLFLFFVVMFASILMWQIQSCYVVTKQQLYCC